MCHFITVALPPKADVHAVQVAARRAKLGWQAVANRAVLDRFEPGTSYFATTRGQCDCDTVLGVLTRTARHRPRNLDRDVAKLRAKGWTETKIARWLEQHEEVRSKQKRAVTARANQRHHEAEQWLAFLKQAVDGRTTRKLGLLLHDYRGSVDTDNLRFTQERVSIDRVDAEFLMKLHDDVMYEFEGGTAA